MGTKGRLGNSLFQIASITWIAKTIGTTAVFPKWKYERYFKNKLTRSHKHMKTLYEPHFHYADNWFEDFKDYEGWFQSEKYFESKEAVKNLFEFETGFRELVKAKYRKLFEKETIAISIRRGDFVGNENYEYIPAKYYIGALLKFDYKDCNLVFFSDDISYCRTHFECLDNAYFVDADAIEQLCLMTLCENHIISQSTFSWWGAYLSESKRVIRPAYNFTEKYKRINDDKDYYPKEWEVFDHKKYFIPLDATFIIPVKWDSPDREENFNLCVKTLKNDFDCEILVGEIGDRFKGDFKKLVFDYPKFHRTKILNILAKQITGIFINFDADVIIPPMQIYISVEKIKQGADMVYPYDGRFARVQRKFYQPVLRFLDCGVLSKHSFEGTRAHELKSYGGAVVFNRESFFKGGAENERFISYAPEDVERFERFTRLGFKVERVKGVIYHMDHFISLDSYIHHQDYPNNEIELQRVRNLTNEELRDEFNYSL